MADPAWQVDPIGFLLGPDHAARFFEEIYEREPLIAVRTPGGRDERRFEDLVSIERLDSLLASRTFEGGQVDVVRADRRMQRTDYTDANNMVDRGAVARQFQTGGTIIFNQLHESDARLADFARAVQRVFTAHVQTNIYLTPPGGQGFRTHYDSHDVFVLQVSGEKLWRLYDRPIGAPYRGEGFEPGAHETREPVETFTLKPGDCAYVPRGLMHDAESSGEQASLHVTLGIITRTWADLLLEAVSEVALDAPELRRALPPGYALDPAKRAVVVREFKSILSRVAERATPEAALDLFADTFIRRVSPDTRGAIAFDGRAIEPNDRFAVRTKLIFRIAEDDQRVAVIAPGGDLLFGEDERDAVARALDGTAFGFEDLAPLAAEQARDVIVKLLAFGLLMRV